MTVGSRVSQSPGDKTCVCVCVGCGCGNWNGDKPLSREVLVQMYWVGHFQFSAAEKNDVGDRHDHIQ